MTGMGEDANGIPGSGVADRLRHFMLAHDLGVEELADFLRIHPLTLAQWFSGVALPPACSLIPLFLLSSLPQARTYPAGCEEEALRRVQAI